MKINGWRAESPQESQEISHPATTTTSGTGVNDMACRSGSGRSAKVFSATDPFSLVTAQPFPLPGRAMPARPGRRPVAQPQRRHRAGGNAQFRLLLFAGRHWQRSRDRGEAVLAQWEQVRIDDVALRMPLAPAAVSD